jgi:hypothetical protein
MDMTVDFSLMFDLKNRSYSCLVSDIFLLIIAIIAIIAKIILTKLTIYPPHLHGNMITVKDVLAQLSEF